MSSPEPARELALLKLINQLADQFETALNAGRKPRIEDILNRIDIAGRARLLRELIRLEIEAHLRQGLTFVPAEYERRFPNDLAVVRSAIQDIQRDPGDTSQAAKVVEQEPESLPRRFGRFTLHARLGAGGFGTVYMADDTRLGRRVAIKIPHPSADGEGQRRFMTEARAAAKLSHANIVTVHDSGVIDGTMFIVSEFIDGADLARTVTERKPNLRQLITWLRDVARGLAHAHSQGVLHRDIKPSNLLINRDNVVYLSDFGLARRIDDQSSLTASGTILGTPAYMAPEQAAGINASVGPASDQYSLGVVLYQVLTGRVPFRGNLQQVLRKVVREEPAPPTTLNKHVPPSLEAICLRALAKNPAHRYPDMLALANDLDLWLQGKPVSVAPASGVTGAAGKLLKSRTMVLLASALGIVGVLGLAISLPFLLASKPTGEKTAKVQPERPEPQNQAEALVPQKTPAPPIDDQSQPITVNKTDREKLITEATRLRTALLANIAPGQAWDFPIASPNGKILRARATFLKSKSDPDKVTLFVTDPSDGNRKSVWTGLVTDHGASADPKLAGTIVPDVMFLFASGDVSLLNGARNFRMAIDEQNRLLWYAATGPVYLEKSTAPAGQPDIARLAEQLRVAISPGRTYQGTLQYPNEETRAVKLTFTEYRDDGQYVRAILEAGDSPFIAVPFVGTVDKSPAALLGGQPLRLVRKEQAMGASGEWPIFSRPRLNDELHLGLSDNLELMGTVDNAQLKFKPGGSYPALLSRQEQWTRLLTAGSTWTGSLRYREAPPRQVQITVAETREELSYIRLLAEDLSNPHIFCVYEGTVNRTDDYVDGFALRITRKTLSPLNHEELLVAREGLFGVGNELWQMMRLSADGSTLYCRTVCGEELTLNRSATPAPRKFERQSAAEVWKAICNPEQVWEGVVRNIQFNQSATVRLQFLALPDALGKVAVRCTWVDQPRIRMDFGGALFLNDDVESNSFALKLNKLGVGQGNSMLFGQPGNVKLQFRLSTDGTTLIGMAGQSNWTELLELKKAIEPPKPTKKSKTK